MFFELRTIVRAIRSRNLYRWVHYESEPGFVYSNPVSSLAHKGSQKSVAIFWDLDNKPPNSVPPYEAASKLKKAASVFGQVRQMVAYANRHAFSYVPPVVREQRRERKLLNQLENKGVIKPVEPYFCGVCGRRFYNNEKLVNHFKQLHEREFRKRLSQIESARGSRRVKLVAKYSMKMEKYKNAARDVLTPKVGYGLAGELKRAGFWVRTVSDKPQAADVALRDHMVDVMDKWRAECLVLVSDDSDFADILREAKLRCVKTVVVGDISSGLLMRVADTGFSWREILMGKAKKEAATVLRRWEDSDVLKRLEWTYDPKEERKLCGFAEDADDGDFDFDVKDSDADFVHKEEDGAWWELDSDSDHKTLKLFR